MRKIMTKAICIKNITTFSFMTLTSFIVLGVFVVKLVEDIQKGKELFIPGVTVLFAGAIVVMVFSIIQIVKHIRMLTEL